MKNRRGTLSILAVVVVLVLGLAGFLLRRGEAPLGRPPLVTLGWEFLQDLRADNRDTTRARIIVLLSPT